ncbi:MarR family winged helix-turn-helix transcriptional regulator [Embleya hyalina]|uniref:MarR family transcriptional regulator n=1 Tax=Embleya hyalina TaxID=516124 RepID=A0A401Z1S4_9ACTN|nr:MarR family transcriptional regulator [Embleya hyalina]GCE00721.1 MarR family transcriptional regulator [Embleya hyalina]
MAKSTPDAELARVLLEMCCVVEGIRGTVSRDLELTPQQSQLLTAVAERELTHGELATRLHCDKTNVTGLVDRLERRDLVRRRPDPNDRRVARVHPTDRGEELVARFRDAVTAAIETRLASWPSDLRLRFAELAQTATGALRS